MDDSTPARRVRRRRPPEVRFQEKVNKRGPDDCWMWTGSLSRGYGSFRVDNTRVVTAHSYAKEIDTGVACPPDMYARHTCTKPLKDRCCNPAHVVYTPRGATLAARRGPDNHRTRFTDAQILDILAAVRAGATQAAVAAQFGTCQSYVGNLVAGRRRTNITRAGGAR